MKRNNTWVAWALAVAMIGYLVGSATVSRSAVVPGFNYSSYATGTALHADLIQAASTGPRVVGADLAYSASNTNSAGFAATSTVGELNLNLQPSNVPFAAKKASARGAGLELGVGSSLPADAGDVLQLAGEAGQAAPPNAATANVTDLGPIALPPVAYASLLHSEARAVDAPLNPCLSTPSSPLSMARGYAADAQLLNTGADLPDDRFAAPVVATDDPNPERSVTQSWSYTYAVPNNFSDSNGLHYGLVTEIHQTYAPVTIIRDAVAGGTLIIEVLGEWVFKTVATGLPGGSQIFYNVIDPATGQQVPKTTPILRIGQGALSTVLDFEAVFGPAGFVLPAALAPLIGLALAEPVRAIAAPGTNPKPFDSADVTTHPTIAPDGTRTAGAVDVLRLNTLAAIDSLNGGHLEDLRIGHFESSITVPTNGFVCEQAVTPTQPTTPTSPPTLPTSTTTTSTTSTTALAPTSSTSSTLKPTSTTTPNPPAAPPAQPIVGNAGVNKLTG